MNHPLPAAVIMAPTPRMIEEELLAIPVKKHVKNYLLMNVFITQPFKLNEYDPIGEYLIKLLQPKRQAKLPLRYKPENVIYVSLGSRKQYNYKRWLSPENAELFNRFIRKLMLIEFGSYMEMGKKLQPDATNAFLIRQFEEKYDLKDTHLNFDNLKRYLYGFKQDDES